MSARTRAMKRTAAQTRDERRDALRRLTTGQGGERIVGGDGKGSRDEVAFRFGAGNEIHGPTFDGSPSAQRSDEIASVAREDARRRA